MSPRGQTRTAIMLLALCGAGCLCAGFVLAEDGPHELLDRMSTAVQTTNYEGTVLRISDGHAEALKVIHTVADGVIREKVIAQEGNGLEIIRNGNEVHCILPEQQSVLVEEWNDQSTLFSTLPSSNLRFGNEYDVKIAGKQRVAGREAMQIAIKPHDEFRYEHRVWLDTETGFPLQTQVIGADGAPLEQIKFADIRLDPEIGAAALTSTYSTENFKWYNQPKRQVARVVDNRWQNASLPLGFRLVSSQAEIMPGSDKVVTHLLYSDGLASVSVFIAAHADERMSKRSRAGASNSYSTVVGEHRITAVGEVPAATVERIATSMESHGEP